MAGSTHSGASIVLCEGVWVRRGYPSGVVRLLLLSIERSRQVKSVTSVKSEGSPPPPSPKWGRPCRRKKLKQTRQGTSSPKRRRKLNRPYKATLDDVVPKKEALAALQSKRQDSLQRAARAIHSHQTETQPRAKTPFPTPPSPSSSSAPSQSQAQAKQRRAQSQRVPVACTCQAWILH